MAIQKKMRINNHLLLPVLPTDITIDILSRLSVDSVLSCKRVCKSWRALIDDPVFTQLHTYRFLLDDDEKQQQQQQQKPEAFEFILFTRFDNYYFGEHTYGDITFKLHNSITHDYPFPLPFENNDYSLPYWLPVSSCNGLICLVSRICHQRICVYNPVTREYLNLPILIYEQQPHSLYYITTGFGYHPCTKEYKVVQIHYKLNKNRSIRAGQGQVSVYTLGSGSSSSSSGWRSKGFFDFKLLNRDVLVNGALHWLSFRYGKMDIIAFDLAEEMFRMVPSPLSPWTQPSYDTVGYSGLGVWEGRYLCVMTLTSTSSNENLYSMWVLNQDYCSWSKNYHSWTKKYDIALNDDSLSHYRPLAQSKGGKILLHSTYNHQMKIVSSDLKSTSFDDEDVHVISLAGLSMKQLKVPCPRYCEIIPYTKSFVSLKALGEDGARTGKKTKELKRVRGENNDGEEQTLAEKLKTLAGETQETHQKQPRKRKIRG